MRPARVDAQVLHLLLHHKGSHFLKQTSGKQKPGTTRFIFPRITPALTNKDALLSEQQTLAGVCEFLSAQPSPPNSINERRAAAVY